MSPYQQPATFRLSQRILVSSAQYILETDGALLSAVSCSVDDVLIDNWQFHVSEAGGTIQVLVQPDNFLDTFFNIVYFPSPTSAEHLECEIGRGNSVGSSDQISFSPSQEGNYLIPIAHDSQITGGTYHLEITSTKNNISNLTQIEFDECVDDDFGGGCH